MLSSSEILDQVNSVIKIVLDNDAIRVNENSTADEIDEWDSLSHIQLVVAIEKHFKIRFNSKEIQGWKNIGELMDSISSKIS